MPKVESIKRIKQRFEWDAFKLEHDFGRDSRARAEAARIEVGGQNSGAIEFPHDHFV